MAKHKKPDQVFRIGRRYTLEVQTKDGQEFVILEGKLDSMAQERDVVEIHDGAPWRTLKPVPETGWLTLRFRFESKGRQEARAGIGRPVRSGEKAKRAGDKKATTRRKKKAT